MVKIDSVLPSPRIVNGIISWYFMDEFEIGLNIKLRDTDGTDIALTENDSVILTIRNDRKEKVKEFEFKNIKDNFINLVFNKEVTMLFDTGVYFYDIRLSGTYNQTIVKNNLIKVE